MSRIMAVAVRDFKATVFRPAFLIALVGVPAFIGGILVLIPIIMLNNEQPDLIGTLAIVDPSGEAIEATREELAPAEVKRDDMEAAQDQAEEALEALENPTLDPTKQMNSVRMGIGRGNVDLTIEPHPNSDELDDLKQRVKSADLVALAVIPPEVLEIPDHTQPRRDWATYELYITDNLDDDHTSFIEDRIGQAIVRVRAQREGQDPDQAMAMLRAPRSSTSRILESGDEATESEELRLLKQLVPMAFMMLVFIGAFTSGQQLLMSTIEEKSNRIMEVLLSAISPFQLMVGKILGQGAVGLLLVAVYGSAGIVGLVSFRVFHVIETIDLVYFVVYYFMAYFMVASMMAAVGSAVSDIREANSLIAPVMMTVWIPWILWMPISQAPNGMVAMVCSYVPPVIPFVMILRLAADEPIAIWQIVVSIVWGYFCVWAMMWGCAKIFRVGVLMQGKPPSPLELLRWIRADSKAASS